MTLVSRMILVLVLAVFAAGSVVHAAGATTMAVEMYTVHSTDMDSSGMGPADCDACSEEDGTEALICDLVCSAVGFAAVPVSDAPELKPIIDDLRQRFSDMKLSGVGNLPLRDPPRPIL